MVFVPSARQDWLFMSCLFYIEGAPSGLSARLNADGFFALVCETEVLCVPVTYP